MRTFASLSVGTPFLFVFVVSFLSWCSPTVFLAILAQRLALTLVTRRVSTRMCRSIALFAALLLVASLGVASDVPRLERRPHIIIFLMDDVGWADVGFHASGSDMHTPTLNSLAASGVELASMYAQPVCSPTRAALLQGRYPFRAGMRMQHFDVRTPSGFERVCTDAHGHALALSLRRCSRAVRRR